MPNFTQTPDCFLVQVAKIDENQESFGNLQALSDLTLFYITMLLSHFRLQASIYSLNLNITGGELDLLHSDFLTVG